MTARYRRALARMLALLALASLALGAPAGARTRRPRRHSPPRVTVQLALARLAQTGAIPQSAYGEYLATYDTASSSRRRLSGTRREELGAVLANVEAMAAKGQLVPSRLPVAFTTLRRNWEWWTAKPLPSPGQRVSFSPGRLVWQYYPGQGLEIQWLASFGAANGYYLSHQTAALQELLDEAIALATQRAGGIAWEYMFRFDGGQPPWSSGLAQGTALQALARAFSRTHEQRYLTAAQQALGLFQTAPPEGVRSATALGAHYLQYTYAPSEHVINGFIQALVGLYEYAKLTGDPLGQQLFESGDAQARAELPSFDTGSWSMYDQHSESDLSYHELLAEFLEHLCERTQAGEPLAAPGGAAIAGDEIYCATAKRFREDLLAPPSVALLTQTVRTSERAGVRLKLSKVSTVHLLVTLGERTVWSNTATVEGGTPRLLWVTPAKPGSYDLVVRAVDLAGNEEVATGSILVKRAPKAKRKKAKAALAQPISVRAQPLPGAL